MAYTVTTSYHQGGHFSIVVSGATQSDGAITVDVFDHVRTTWKYAPKSASIQVEIVGSPTTGSLSVAVQSYGSTTYATLSETINMVSGPYAYTIKGIPIKGIRITPTSYNGTSYNVIINVFN